MCRYVLAREGGYSYKQGQQQQCTLVDHDETSAVREGTEIRLTELRKFGCWSSMEKLARAAVISTAIVTSAAILCEDSQVMPESLPKNTDVPGARLFLRNTEEPVSSRCLPECTPPTIG
jgi:hypothetical protein